MTLTYTTMIMTSLQMAVKHHKIFFAMKVTNLWPKWVSTQKIRKTSTSPKIWEANTGKTEVLAMPHNMKNRSTIKEYLPVHKTKEEWLSSVYHDRTSSLASCRDVTAMS